MAEVNVTELRQNLPAWLDRVQTGEQIAITLRGVVIARLIPPGDVREEAKAKLAALRAQAFVGDVESPLDVTWTANAHP